MTINIDNLDHKRLGAVSSTPQVERLQVETNATRTSAMGRQAAGRCCPLVSSTAAAPTHDSRPLAPVGMPFPLKLDARSIDLSPILPSESLST